MSDNRYNGWANRPTWAVNLWLSNDEGSYRYWLDATEHAVDTDMPSREADGIDDPDERADAVYTLSEALDSYLEEHKPTDFGMYDDLLGYVLADVDCYEIAVHMVDDYLGDNPPPEPEADA